MTVVKIGVAAVIVVGAVVGGVLHHTFGAFLPWRESGEAERLADMMGVTVGQTVADVGAGSGLFSVKMAERVGEAGKVYATELSAANRDAIRSRALAAGVRNLVVVEAAPLETNLPDACCDLVYLRNVYHHIKDPDTFGKSLRKAVRSGGRLAVIDFAPGALWFIGGRPSESSERRTGHGVALPDARSELTSAGFELEREISNWSGPLWLVVFTAGDPR